MKEYHAPNLAVVKVEVGTSFAAYHCYERVTWLDSTGVCDPNGPHSPMIDAYGTGGGSNGCWHGDVG